MWTKLCTKLSKILRFLSSSTMIQWTFFSVNWHTSFPTSSQIQLYHEPKIILVQNVDIAKLSSSKHKHVALKKRWDFIMFAPTKTARIDGPSKLKNRRENSITNLLLFTLKDFNLNKKNINSTGEHKYLYCNLNFIIHMSDSPNNFLPMHLTIFPPDDLLSGQHFATIENIRCFLHCEKKGL